MKMLISGERSTVALAALVLALFVMANVTAAKPPHTEDLAATWDPQTQQTVDGEQVYTWNAGSFDNWVDADRNPGADPSSGQVGIVGTGPQRAVLDGTATVRHNLYVGMDRDRKSTVYRGKGELQITAGGSLNLPEGHRSFVIGHGAAGTVNQNGGSVSQNYYAKGILIGRGAQGIYNLNSGTLNALEDVYVGWAGDHNSQMNVMGGTFNGDDNMSVFVGQDKRDGTGTFYVHGSNPGKIVVGKKGTGEGKWIQAAGGTLKLGIDQGGLTPIEIRTDVMFKDGATLDVNILGDSARVGCWDVMTWEGQLVDNGLQLADTMDKNDWAFEFIDTEDDGSADTLRVTSVPHRSDEDLVRIAAEADDYYVRLIAANKISDKEIVSLDHQVAAVRHRALLDITDQTVLARVAVEDESENVRAAATERLKPDAAIFKTIALNDESPRVRLQAVEKVTDQKVLAQIALHDKSERVRIAAAEKLAPETAELRKVAFNTTCPRVQKVVFAKTTGTRMMLGDIAGSQHWSGLEPAPNKGQDGEDAARFKTPGEATFRYGDEKREQAADWSDWTQLAFEVKLPADRDVADLTVSLKGSRKDYRKPVKVTTTKAGWQTVYIPLDEFLDHDNVPPYALLHTVSGLDIKTNQNAELLISAPRLQRGRKIGLMFPVQSKAGDLGETLTYEGTVVNYTDRPQSVNMRLDRQGAAVMPTTVEPRQFQLAPGETQSITVEADIPTPNFPGVQGKLPQGARERWRVEAVPGADLPMAERSELIHLVEVESPYLVHTEAEWEEIRNLVETEAWAKKKAESMISRARSWKPQKPNPPDAEFAYGGVKNSLTNAALAYNLTHDRAIAEKLAAFLRAFADPETGYPANGQFVGGARTIRHGSTLRAFAKAYAAIRDTEVLTEEDHRNIAAAFRLAMQYPRGQAYPGNQPLQSVTGGLFAALAIQDWKWVEYYLEGPGKLYWNIRRGIMDDGWFVEMSTGYNIISAKLLTKSGLALRPWGVDVLTRQFPAVYHENYRNWADPGEEISPRGDPKSGVFTSVWGPSRRNYRCIRDTWDATIPMMTEEGTVPGLNDSGAESSISTNSLYLAAYAYDDPTYLRATEEHNLLYPVDIPEKQQSSTELLPCVAAHNAGVDLLRSQGVDSPKQQYQTLLSYGPHGGMHGHWDRLNMGWLRRFGRIVMHTPKPWYRYKTPMYKFGMSQPSLAHNMLIVDGKNQWPAPSYPIAFHAGNLFQVTAVENKTRWANPPYGGANKEWLEEQGWYKEDRGVMEFTVRGGGPTMTLPVPEDHPEWGHMNDFTEPVRSRRLLATTDEYILVVDHVSAPEKHTYDVIFNLPNFQGLGGTGDTTLAETREQYDDSPLRTGQLITNARFYQAEGNVRAHFKPGYPESSSRPWPFVPENGSSLSVDVHTVWPAERQQVVGDNPPISGNPRNDGWTFYSAGRKKAREASFVTLIEVQKDKADRQVKNIDADGPGQLKVTLADGRTHTWRIEGLNAEKDRPSSITIEMVEKSKEGDVLARERVK